MKNVSSFINPVWIDSGEGIDHGWIVLRTVTGREVASINPYNFVTGMYGGILIHVGDDRLAIEAGIVRPVDPDLDSAKEYCRRYLEAVGYRFLTPEQANLL